MTDPLDSAPPALRRLSRRRAEPQIGDTGLRLTPYVEGHAGPIVDRRRGPDRAGRHGCPAGAFVRGAQPRRPYDGGNGDGPDRCAGDVHLRRAGALHASAARLPDRPLAGDAQRDRSDPWSGSHARQRRHGQRVGVDHPRQPAAGQRRARRRGLLPRRRNRPGAPSAEHDRHRRGERPGRDRRRHARLACAPAEPASILRIARIQRLRGRAR